MHGINSTDRKRSRANLLLRDGPWCQLCNEVGHTEDNDERDDPLFLTLDHVVPRVKGGRPSKRNMQLAHRRCNSEKGCDVTISPVQRTDDVL